jgi:hypothetical protein
VTGESKPGVRKVSYEPAEPVDIVAVAGAPVLKRVGPVLAGLAVLALVLVLIRQRT